MLGGRQKAKEEKFIARAQALSRGAKSLHLDRAPESEWQELLNKTILDQRDDQYVRGKCVHVR
jgi:hypothetical protein